MLIDFFRERGREGERGRETSTSERNIDQLCVPTGHQICNPGMCPDGESNSRPFGVQDDAPTHRDMPAKELTLFFIYSLHLALFCISFKYTIIYFTKRWPQYFNYIIIAILLTTFCNYQSVHLNLFTSFIQAHNLPPLWHPSVCSLYL